MCTVVLGLGVVRPRTVLIGANRDENPARPADPPALLREQPRLTGGRDRVAGGSWLVVRDGTAVVAVLNRRDSSAPGAAPPTRRSRGLLLLDVASAAPGGSEDELPGATLEEARRRVAAADYAPFSLLFASPAGCWVLGHDGGPAPRVLEPSPGWHVITHADLDDPGEPRTARLVRELRGFAPRSAEEAERRVEAILRDHGVPPVCIHEGPMPTVSSALLWLAPGEVRYRHAEGRPCENPFVDYSPLLAHAASAPED